MEIVSNYETETFWEKQKERDRDRQRETERNMQTHGEA